jgi:uncharacterized membrane protein
MLIVFPLGLLATAVIFDLIAKFTGNHGLCGVSYWMMAAGIVGKPKALDAGNSPVEDHAADSATAHQTIRTISTKASPRKIGEMPFLST